MNDLHLSDEAQADLAGIKSYIAKDLENPSAALPTVQNKHHFVDVNKMVNEQLHRTFC